MPNRDLRAGVIPYDLKDYDILLVRFFLHHELAAEKIDEA